MVRPLEDREEVEVKSREQLRAWLTEHHEQPDGVWVVTYKKHCGDRYVPYDSVVEEALCFGWIDSLPRRKDADRTMLYVSPRKAGSPWSRLNKQRIEALRVSGAMQPEGEAKIDEAARDGSWTIYDEVEDLVVPPDLAKALDAAAARQGWDATAPSLRKGTLWQIKSAKRPATRARRIEKAVAEAKRSQP